MRGSDCESDPCASLIAERDHIKVSGLKPAHCFFGKVCDFSGCGSRSNEPVRLTHYCLLQDISYISAVAEILDTNSLLEYPAALFKCFISNRILALLAHQLHYVHEFLGRIIREVEVESYTAS